MAHVGVVQFFSYVAFILTLILIKYPLGGDNIFFGLIL